MSEAVRISPSFKLFHRKKSPYLSRDFLPHFSNPALGRSSLAMNYTELCCIRMNTICRRGKALTRHGEEGIDPQPVSVELEPISSENHFDRVIAEAQQLEEPVIILWMASWCRRCIYLKPKLEKLAADYYRRIQFYCVDVNNVSHKLVARAEVTKMPTIQLWKDGKKQGEVIGGHKAYLVVNEVRDLIENDFTV